MMLRDALVDAVPRLEAAGVDTPRLDAELLLAHSLGRNRTYLYAHLPDPLPADAAHRFARLLQRRAAREPLPYLLGAWEFMGLSFEVSPAVLIPRPETEVLVEAVAERVAPNARVLDVGAGSGCISVALARLLPQCQVTALEPSPEARAVAERNVAALGAAERVRILAGFFPQDADGLGPFDALVSNPPYIPTAEVEGLAPELRLHEPRLALDGGADGLTVLRALARDGAALLAPGGLLAVELAQGQAGAVCELLASAGQWDEPESLPDLAGIARVVLARRSRATGC